MRTGVFAMYDLIELGGTQNIPRYLLPVSKTRDDYEAWLIASNSCSHIHKALFSVLCGHDYFIDVGANIGSVLLPAAALGCVCVGFEPIPALCERLLIGARVNRLHNMFVLNMGISNRDGVSGVVEQGPSGVSSWLSNLAQQKVLISTMDTLFYGWMAEHSGSRRVLIKIDVEGHEPEVFQGAINLLHKKRPIVCFESIVILNRPSASRMQEVKQMLQKVDYELYEDVNDRFYATDGERCQIEHVGNCFAFPRELAHLANPNIFIASPPSIDERAAALDRLAADPLRWSRAHAACILKHFGAEYAAVMDVTGILSKLRHDPDEEVARAAA
jgi:FkbM family methyltransferase